MKDREYYLKMISDRLDRKLTQSEESELAAAQQCDPSLVEYERRLLAQRDVLRSLPTPANTLSSSALVAPTHQIGIMRRAWRAQVRIPLPAAAAAVVCLIGWSWFASVSDPKTTNLPALIHTKYVQVERLEPAIAVPAAYTIDSVTTTIKEGEL